jgi:pimeloyl-ACP methyl ester carboxylesterase
MVVSTVRSLEGTVEIDGYRCAFRRTGRSDPARLPVFFIAGAFQSMASWKHFVEHFEPTTSVLIADLPGTGDADVLPSDRGLDFLADAACALMDAGGIERAYVVGASYGSPVAYRLAQRHPERVARVALAGVMRKIPDHRRSAARATLDAASAGDTAAFAQRVIEGLLCGDPERPIERRRLATRVLSGQLRQMGELDLRRYQENTERLLHHTELDLDHPPTAPALVFTGEHDIFTTPEYCREVAAALPNALYTTIKRADHLFHIERFGVTLALLARFHESDDLSTVDGCHPVERLTTAALTPTEGARARRESEPEAGAPA